jgi:hypothetical protein
MIEDSLSVKLDSTATFSFSSVIVPVVVVKGSDDTVDKRKLILLQLSIINIRMVSIRTQYYIVVSEYVCLG